MEQNAQKEREKILEIKNLCMEFPAGKKKTVKALNNVTFDIYKGENFGLVGESGWGPIRSFPEIRRSRKNVRISPSRTAARSSHPFYILPLSITST